MFIQLIAGKTIEEQIEELKKEIEKKKKIISEMKGENNNFLKEKNNDKSNEEKNNHNSQEEKKISDDLDKRIERLEHLVNEIRNAMFNKQNIPIGNAVSDKKEIKNNDNHNEVNQNEPRFKEKDSEKKVDNAFTVNDDIHNLDDDELEKFIRSTKIPSEPQKPNPTPLPIESKKNIETHNISIFKEP